VSLSDLTLIEGCKRLVTFDSSRGSSPPWPSNTRWCYSTRMPMNRYSSTCERVWNGTPTGSKD